MTGKELPGYHHSLFEQLYSCYEPALYQLACKVTKSPEQSRDIVQEVFLHTWEQIGRFSHIEDAGAYLYRATENKLIDFLRKTAADQRLRHSLLARIAPAAQDVADVLDGRECQRAIQAAIGRLPRQRQKIYLLNREAGLNYQEIARELSISRHTVKNQLSAALRFLQQFLSGK